MLNWEHHLFKRFERLDCKLKCNFIAKSGYTSMKNILIALLLFLSAASGYCQQRGYHGIDVSHHNGKIAWNVVKQNKRIQFVYIKASEGKTYVDPNYRTNLRNARKNGLKVGSYHFFRMTSGAHEQFRHFKNVVKKGEQNLIPMVDVETNDRHSIKETRDSLRVFLRLVEKYYGVKPMIYGTNRSYNTICGIWFNRYKLYLGRYGQNPPKIRGSEHYLIWQYSEKGRIKGIPKPVDLCRFHPKHAMKDIIYRKPSKKR